jgi:hypothetical protein
MKRRFDGYKGPLAPKAIADGIDAANANARRLAADAKLRPLFDEQSDHPYLLDMLKQLPFAAETFDLLVVIHPHSVDVLPAATSSLRVGGHVIFETFGAHGENWRWLPKRHQVTDALLAGFEVLVCKESPVAKSPDFVTVKGIFRKINGP